MAFEQSEAEIVEGIEARLNGRPWLPSYPTGPFADGWIKGAPRRAAGHINIQSERAANYATVLCRLIEPKPPESKPANDTDAKAEPEPAEETPEKPAHYDRDAEPFPGTWFADEEPVLVSNWLVEGFLPGDGYAVIWGPPGCTKTFLTMDQCLHVAAGMPWHGRRVEQRGVVYVGLEGQRLAGNRVVAWKRHHGKEGVRLPFVRLTSGVNLMDQSRTGDAARLVATVRDAVAACGFPVGLIVIDTLAASMPGGDENAGKDMSLVTNTMRKLREETGALIALKPGAAPTGCRSARPRQCRRILAPWCCPASRTERATAKTTRAGLGLGAEQAG